MRSFRVQLAPADHDSARPKPPRHGDPALAAPPGRHDAQNQSQRRRRPLSQPPVTNRDSDTGLGPDDPPVVVLPPEHCQQLLPRPLSPGAAYPTVPPAQHLHPGVVPYRIRSASPQCARSDPPGVWLDIDEDEDNDDNDSDGTECLSPSDDGFDSDGYYGDGPSRLLDGAPFDYDHDCATPGAPSGCADWPAGPVRRWRAQHATTPPSLALTPFVNQVGGHTPFLKFSGSAICKPMNERERRFYEAVDYLHPDLYKFVPSCLGVVNVTYRRPLDGSDPVPEVFLEQNLHILPSCLARQLVPSRASQPQCTAAPGSFGARKMRLSGAWREMQERILKDALSPRALKVRARQQARMRAQGPIRRRHSSTDLHPAHHIAAVPVSDRGLADESQDEARSLTADNSGEPRDPAGAQLGPIYSVAVSRSSTADTESNDGDSSPALSSQPNASGGRGHERCREPPLTPNIPTMPLPEANRPQPHDGNDASFVNLWKKKCGKRMPTDVEAVDGSMHQFILMADLTAAMRRPCILDLKMGTRQHGVDALAKKVVSQTIKCAATTSKELGVRMCGLQVYKADRNRFLFQDKYYGRSLNKFTFQRSLLEFLDNGERVMTFMIPALLTKLHSLYRTVVQIHGFRFFGSSLLLVYDGHAATRAAEAQDETLSETALRVARRPTAFEARDMPRPAATMPAGAISISTPAADPMHAPMHEHHGAPSKMLPISLHAKTPANSFNDRLDPSTPTGLSAASLRSGWSAEDTPAGCHTPAHTRQHDPRHIASTRAGATAAAAEPSAAVDGTSPQAGLLCAAGLASPVPIDLRIIDFVNCSFVIDPDLYAEPTLQRPEAASHEPCPQAPPSPAAEDFHVTEASPVPTCPCDDKCAGPDYGYLRGVRTLVREFADIWRRYAPPDARLLHDQTVLQAAEGVGVRLKMFDARHV